MYFVFVFNRTSYNFLFAPISLSLLLKHVICCPTNRSKLSIPALITNVTNVTGRSSASEMTYIVSSGALNSTHSLTTGRSISYAAQQSETNYLLRIHLVTANPASNHA